MASSTARFARPPRFPFADGTHPLRAPLPGEDSRREAVVDPDHAARREPAWLADLTERITRSVNAIERVVERVGTMREDNSYLRTVTSNLREALEAERAEAGRKLIEQGRSISQEKRRTAEAERSADALAGMLCDLERQLSGRRDATAGRPAGLPASISYEGSFRQGERAPAERVPAERVQAGQPRGLAMRDEHRHRIG